MHRGLLIFIPGLFGLINLPGLVGQEPITPEYKQHYAAAAEALKNKDFDRALEEINRAEANTPGKIPTLELRGNIYIEREQYDLAQKDFETILSKYPGYPGAIYNLAEVQFLNKDYSQAGKTFQQYLELEGKERNALVRYKLFLCDLMMGNSKAVKAQLAALKPTISHPLEYFCRAAVEYHQGNQAEGDDLLNSAFQIYSAPLNLLFMESLKDLGFVKGENVPGIDRIDGVALDTLSREFMPEPDDPAKLQKDLNSLLPEVD